MRCNVFFRVRQEEDAKRKSEEAARLAREAKLREKEKLQRVSIMYRVLINSNEKVVSNEDGVVVLKWSDPAVPVGQAWNARQRTGWLWLGGVGESVSSSSAVTTQLSFFYGNMPAGFITEYYGSHTHT